MAPTAAEAAALGVAFTLRSFADLQALPAPAWAIKGLIPARGVGAIYGASASGKTFLALDLGLHLASGLPWFGLRTPGPLPVVYIALEAGAGISRRVDAWLRPDDSRHVAPCFLTVIEGGFSLLDAVHVESLAATILKSVGLGAVIIIDTLNRAMAGSDENSSLDMGAAVDGAFKLQEAVQGLVLLVHHSGKDSAKGMRGHSSLFAAMDAVIEVERKGEARSWRLAKAKDARDDLQFGFRLDGVTLGADEDGDPIISCYVMRDTLPAPEPKEPGGAVQRTVLRVLAQLLQTEGTPDESGRAWVPLRRLEEAALSELTGDGQQVKSQAKRNFHRALDSLEKGGFAQRTDWKGSALRDRIMVALAAG